MCMRVHVHFSVTKCNTDLCFACASCSFFCLWLHPLRHIAWVVLLLQDGVVDSTELQDILTHALRRGWSFWSCVHIWFALNCARVHYSVQMFVSRVKGFWDKMAVVFRSHNLIFPLLSLMLQYAFISYCMHEPHNRTITPSRFFTQLCRALFLAYQFSQCKVSSWSGKPCVCRYDRRSDVLWLAHFRAWWWNVQSGDLPVSFWKALVWHEFRAPC